MNTNLKSKTIHGVKWNALAHAVDKGFNYLLIIILAKVITPDDFGIMAMVTAFTMFFSIIHEFNIASVTIQKNNITERFLKSISALNYLVGILFAVLVFILATPLSKFYEQDLIRIIIRVLSISYIINSFHILPIALLRKKFRFYELFKINLFAFTLASCCTLVFAFVFDFGIWSLVFHILFVAFFKSLIAQLVLRVPISFIYDKQTILEIKRYCLPLIGSKSLFYWTSFFDFVLLGKYFEENQLGYYSQSNSLVEITSQSISSIVGNVLLSSFSLVQNDLNRIKDVFVKALGAVATITLPVNLVIITISDSFIKSFFNENWEPMIPILQSLCVFGAIKSISILNGNVFMSLGKTALQFKINLFTRPLVIVAVFLGLPFGVLGVIYGKIIGVLIGNIINFYYLLKVINCKYHKVLVSLLIPLIASIVMIVCSHLFELFFLQTGITDLLRLILLLIISAISYMMISLLINRKTILRLLSIVKEAF